MEAVISDGVNIDGFNCPGHVAVVTGSGIFSFIPLKYQLGCVVTGFEPVDLMQSILMLIRQKNNMTPGWRFSTAGLCRKGKSSGAENHERIFEPCESYWRGFGLLRTAG
jgi:hydrogenase expression/formation protein HypD